MYFDVIIAGFGGQGVLLMGDLVAYAAMKEGKHVTYMPTYGVEMRGGTAMCTVIIADDEIGSPLTARPQAVIVMNEASLDKYQPIVKPGGLVFVNTSLIPKDKVTRTDLDVVLIAANDLAAQLGNSKMSNMIVLGTFVERTGIVKLETIEKSFADVMPERWHGLIPLNVRAMNIGAEFSRSALRTQQQECGRSRRKP
jgi:2-oxoglutarate ferredoxin oxidoreductase subunit gamma